MAFDQDIGALKDRRIAFVHVPKTAGTSLGNIFSELYGQRVIHVNLPSNEGDFPSLLAGRCLSMDDFDVVSGHMPVGFARTIYPNLFMLSVLRRPIDRVLSDYRYVLGKSDHPLHERLASGMWSRLDFFRCKYASNIQCRRLFPFEKNEDGVYYKTINDQTLLDGALDTLGKLDCVGLTERFADTLKLIAAKLDWPSVPEIRFDNRTENSTIDFPTGEERAGLEENNALDQDLYQAAEKRFTSDLEALVAHGSEGAHS